MTRDVGRSGIELVELLERRIVRGLVPREVKRAIELIDSPSYYGEDCLVCLRTNENPVYPAIYHSGMCQSHARYMLGIE